MIVEAEQWFDGPTIDDVHLLTHTSPEKETEYWPHIHTLEGELRVSPGDWIITGVEGEKYPCKPHIFQQTYEPAGDDAYERGYRDGYRGVGV